MIVKPQITVSDFTPVQIDCITCLMLKILDGKCKMSAGEKTRIEELYNKTCTFSGLNLGAKHHQLIAKARRARGKDAVEEALKEEIYEQRLYGETMISRPVMKNFKARLRKKGYLPQR